jgi:hypothetical protein
MRGVWEASPGLVRGGAHLFLAVACLAVVWYVVRRREGRGGCLPRPGAPRDVLALLAFCVLIQVGEVLGVYRPANGLLAAVSVATAVGLAAAYRRPGAGRSDGPGGCGLPGCPSEEYRREIAARASAARDLAARYDRLKSRVHTLEETLRRCTWIQQSREAMAQLNAMLRGCESLLDHSEVESERGPSRRGASGLGFGGDGEPGPPLGF